MSATLYSAVKASLEGRGLGISVYRDAAPQAAVRPLVVFTGDIAMRLEPLEDGGVSTGAEEFQLDLYETWRGSDDKAQESATLADAITESMHGVSLSFGTPAKRVYGCLQRLRTRLVDRDSRVIRHTYQFDAMRQI